jgi:hypothetical protein
MVGGTLQRLRRGDHRRRGPGDRPELRIWIARHVPRKFTCEHDPRQASAIIKHGDRGFIYPMQPFDHACDRVAAMRDDGGLPFDARHADAFERGDDAPASNRYRAASA